MALVPPESSLSARKENVAVMIMVVICKIRILISAELR
jgi:hypothetical protein